jgi:diguanylate cyclase (GGDEF)-like protein
MHSANLLVTDRSPESAEHINSLLRNSGIKIHVIHAASSVEVKRALDRDTPVLVLYGDADESEAPLDEINQLAAAFDIPLALFTGLDDAERLCRLLEETACYVINSAREDLLAEAVGRLIRAGEKERDIEARQRYLEELEHRYDLVLDSSRDAIAYIHEGLHVHANRAYLEALHVGDDGEIAGLSLLELLEAGDTNLKALLKGFSKGQFPTEPLEASVKRPDGSTFDAQLAFSPARFNGEDCTQMIVQRKDEANVLAAELERLRFVDPVTQFHNRKAFTEELESWITGGQGDGTAAVLYIEPDGFDQLQEELSADSVDAFVADIAGLIRNSLSAEDVPARIVDSGFAVLARRGSASELEALAQSILQACRGHVVELTERSLTLSCSIGLSNVGRITVDSAELIASARKAQLEAAENGDSVVVYRPQLTAVAAPDGESEWLERIRLALNNHDFYSVQQPIIDLDGDGGQLLENTTFMRGEGGDHGPDEFLPFADRADLAGAIDREVIPGLLKLVVESGERQIINISSNSVLDYGFPAWFAEQLEAACVEGSKVYIQVAATVAQSNLRPVQRLLKELEPLGVRLSLSHFTAERRTCQLLEHLPASLVKLHPSLTEDLTANSKSQEAIRKVVEAAEPHTVDVIADEVADTSSLAVLWQCGIKLVAGTFLRESTQVLAQ